MLITTPSLFFAITWTYSYKKFVPFGFTNRELYKMKIAIINGPNLNLVGTREPSIYGKQKLNQLYSDLSKKYSTIGLSFFQSNVEGEIINEIQRVGFDHQGIILNAGAYTHTSVAIGDAIAAITTPVIEVHISNVYAREDFRHHSFLARHCVGVISGLGFSSYAAALKYFIQLQT